MKKLYQDLKNSHEEFITILTDILNVIELIYEEINNYLINKEYIIVKKPNFLIEWNFNKVCIKIFLNDLMSKCEKIISSIRSIEKQFKNKLHFFMFKDTLENKLIIKLSAKKECLYIRGE